MTAARGPLTWRRRLVLLGALVAFLLPAIAAPFGRLCLCLHGGTPVAVGGCCCDAPAAPKEPGCDDAACPRGAVCAEDASCSGESCDCVDVTSPGDPFASIDRRAEPLPSPEIVALAATSPVTVLFSCAAPCMRSIPPPEPPDPPPLRTRVLRC